MKVALNDSPASSDFLFPELVAYPPPPPAIDVGVPLPSLLLWEHSSMPDLFFSFPIRMPATHTTLIDDELLSIIHKIIFITAPIMTF